MEQLDLIETAAARSLLDQLLNDSRLYRTGADFKALLDFVVQLRNFAPFNAMLLEIQKPGLTYAASALDWQERFGRTVKKDSRPLLILWPFAPVAFVYDIQDTEGQPFPPGVSPFVTDGNFDEERLWDFTRKLDKKSIHWIPIDKGEGKAGSIQCVHRPHDLPAQYELRVNRNHSTEVKFTTLLHELAHLFLGHLGRDIYLKIPDRSSMDHAAVEIEAESVAYIICHRNGLKPRSDSYLSKYVAPDADSDSIGLYQIMRAAGQIETLLGLAVPTRVEKPARRQTTLL
jgi:hypothetical protein